MTVSAITPEGMQISIPEADNAINRVEASNGTPLIVTLPIGARVGDSLRLTLTNPGGTVTTQSTSLTSSLLAAGTATMTVTAARIATDGTYSASVALLRGGLQQGSAAAMTFVVDQTRPQNIVAGDDPLNPPIGKTSIVFNVITRV